MGGSAESREPDIVSVLHVCQAERTIADGPRAEKRRGLGIAEDRRYFIHKSFRDGCILRIAAVRVPACCPEIAAEILPAAGAEPAPSAGRKDPCHAYPRADFKSGRPFSRFFDPDND